VNVVEVDPILDTNVNRIDDLPAQASVL